MYPEPLFKIFGQGVYLYGIMMAVALVSALLVFRFYTDKTKIDTDVQNFGLLTGVFAIAGGFFVAALAQGIVSAVNGDGFSFSKGITVMPGVIGGAVAYLAIYFGVGHFYFKKKGMIHLTEFKKIFNMAPCAITLAHGFGRIGCLFAGCCHGRETDAWYGIVMDGVKRVPTQLFEAIFLFALFAVLSVLYFKDKRYTFPVYLMAYGLWRFVIEYFRDDISRGNFMGIKGFTSSQFTSILFELAGVLILVVHILCKKGIIKNKLIGFNIDAYEDRQPKIEKATVATEETLPDSTAENSETVADENSQTNLSDDTGSHDSNGNKTE